MTTVTAADIGFTIPSFSFHRTTFGQNVRLENNGLKAVRHTSYDHGIFFSLLRINGYLVLKSFSSSGITFTDRPININERIHIKIVEVDETRQWCGSLSIGEKKNIELLKQVKNYFRIYSSRSKHNSTRRFTENSIAKCQSR